MDEEAVSTVPAKTVIEEEENSVPGTVCHVKSKGKVYKTKVIVSGIFFNIINITVSYATCSNTPTFVTIGSKEEMEAKEKEETQGEEEEHGKEHEEEHVAPLNQRRVSK